MKERVRESVWLLGALCVVGVVVGVLLVGKPKGDSHCLLWTKNTDRQMNVSYLRTISVE